MTLKPMLAQPVDVTDLDRFINDDDYDAQQKLDGDRIMIVTDNGGTRALNRAGEDRRNAVPRAVLDQFSVMPTAMAFDGELLLDGTLWLFDLPFAGELVVASQPYEFRSQVLAKFFEGWRPDPCIRLLESFRSPTDKRWLVNEVERIGGEGVVLKKRSAPYRAGKRSHGTLKAKFTKTIDVVVTELGIDNKHNAGLHVFDGGRAVHVGTVSLNGKPPVNVGDVIEVRYLYATDDRRLFQPRMLRVRTDKAATECSIDQLSFTDRRVLTAATKGQR